MKFALAAAVLAAVVAGQAVDIGSLPQCLVECAVAPLTSVASACPQLVGDAACLCGNEPFVSALLTCADQKCDKSILDQKDSLVAKLCPNGAAGYTAGGAAPADNTTTTEGGASNTTTTEGGASNTTVTEGTDGANTTTTNTTTTDNGNGTTTTTNTTTSTNGTATNGTTGNATTPGSNTTKPSASASAKPSGGAERVVGGAVAIVAGVVGSALFL